MSSNWDRFSRISIHEPNTGIFTKPINFSYIETNRKIEMDTPHVVHSLINNKSKSPEAKHSKEMGSNIKVFFGNLAPVTTESEMYNLFKKYGKCSGLVILKDRKQRPRGAGFVTFSSYHDACTAIESLDRKITLPGAHKPLEVRFPEDKCQKRDRMKSLKESKLKTYPPYPLTANEESNQHDINNSSHETYQKPSSNEYTVHMDSVFDISSNDDAKSNSNRQSMFKDFNCSTCGADLLIDQFCLDCRRGVYLKATN